MKSTKIIFTSATVLLLSLFATSCIPTTPVGGNPTPSNTFNVNLATEVGGTVDTIIVVDGDSLSFQFFTGLFNEDFTRNLIISTNHPNFEILNTKEYPYNLNTNQYDNTQTPVDANTINEGILINDAYTANPWLPFIYVVSGFAKPYINAATLDISLSGWGLPSGYTYGMKKNTDQYIVLRKLKNSQHQYYWIRVRQDNNGPYPGFKVLNGKYQMNSITTGQ
ncbi:MAG: hypothetical protein IT271_09550 [Chitinophagales bacterium]|nr:hypothetical protein [Chitinophagales bacterium]